jgi:ABC-type spermidine/putrescine transport system permease subunit II
MARDVDVVAPRAGLARGLFGAWAVLVYVFLFAPIVLLVAFSFNANTAGQINGSTT